jgi:hypothetical protein
VARRLTLGDGMNKEDQTKVVGALVDYQASVNECQRMRHVKPREWFLKFDTDKQPESWPMRFPPSEKCIKDGLWVRVREVIDG